MYLITVYQVLSNPGAETALYQREHNPLRYWDIGDYNTIYVVPQIRRRGVS